MKVYFTDISFEQTPKYLGVTLDRTLSFKVHLTSVAGKVHARSNLLRRLSSNSWGVDIHVLQISALANSVEDYALEKFEAYA